MKKPSVKLVREMMSNYRSKVKTNPNLYLCRDGSLNVSLSSALCWDYSNASAGDSGGSNPRPVGIRRTKQELAGTNRQVRNRIFASESALTQFIQSSECNGAAHLLGKIAKKKARAKVIVANPPYKTAPAYNVSSVTVGPNKNEIVIKLLLVA
jgi:hypothetical protein